jgi:hypothetical protein
VTSAVAAARFTKLYLTNKSAKLHWHIAGQ